jgi:integrase
VAGALRSFLRYLQFHGLRGSSLIAAVPIIRGWRLSRLPKAMTEKQRQDFLSEFDRSTATGRRNYAMVLCQLDLGLRVSEVARLRLDDINWREAIVRIEVAKTGRARELPLPVRVGRAISQYFRNGRPSSSDRHVFLRHRWRHGVAVGPDVIRRVIYRTFAKMKGCEHLRGSHVLRHTAATQMLRNGASLKKIADVLGHRSMNTTVIYAKVDLRTLAAVALPWPGVQP